MEEGRQGDTGERRLYLYSVKILKTLTAFSLRWQEDEEVDWRQTKKYTLTEEILSFLPVSLTNFIHSFVRRRLKCTHHTSLWKKEQHYPCVILTYLLIYSSNSYMCFNSYINSSPPTTPYSITSNAHKMCYLWKSNKRRELKSYIFDFSNWHLHFFNIIPNVESLISVNKTISWCLPACTRSVAFPRRMLTLTAPTRWQQTFKFDQL